ncbi:MAG: hypothetical protein K0V04_30905 [Deltaproteobacteria bacterium]|nr:hypothetical protein [Deltaproteobacteria bacterium]
MSKWLWLFGAGAGALVLSGAGRKASDDGDPKTDDPDTRPTPPTGGSEGGNTPEPEWLPEPYETYPRGPYTVDLTGLSSGIRWRVFETATRPTIETGRDAAKLGAGIGASDAEARVAANAFIDALGALPVEPFPLPPKPTPDPPGGLDGAVLPVPPPPSQPGGLGGMARFPVTAKPPQYQRHGLNIYDNCTRIEVDDLISWIAWAEPFVRERIVGTNGEELVMALLRTAFPKCSWDLANILVMGGRRLQDRIATIEDKYFAAFRVGHPSIQASPWEPLPLERAVAELLNVRAPTIAPPEFAYRGYHVELDQVDGQWVWRAWWRGKDGGGADLSGGPVVSWRVAVADVQAEIAAAGG